MEVTEENVAVVHCILQGLIQLELSLDYYCLWSNIVHLLEEGLGYTSKLGCFLSLNHCESY